MLFTYEQNIAAFISVLENQPSLFSQENYTELLALIEPLPDDNEKISEAISLWVEKKSEIFDSQLETLSRLIHSNSHNNVEVLIDYDCDDNVEVLIDYDCDDNVEVLIDYDCDASLDDYDCDASLDESIDYSSVDYDDDRVATPFLCQPFPGTRASGSKKGHVPEPDPNINKQVLKNAIIISSNSHDKKKEKND